MRVERLLVAALLALAAGACGDDDTALPPEATLLLEIPTTGAAESTTTVPDGDDGADEATTTTVAEATGQGLGVSPEEFVARWNAAREANFTSGFVLESLPVDGDDFTVTFAEEAEATLRGRVAGGTITEASLSIAGVEGDAGSFGLTSVFGASLLVQTLQPELSLEESAEVVGQTLLIAGAIADGTEVMSGPFTYRVAVEGDLATLTATRTEGA